jgi:polyhydroxyalkanoate synthesis regulator phasin
MEPTLEKKTLAESFQHLWGQAFMAVTGADEEAANVVQKFQHLAGWSQEEAKKQLKDFSQRITSQRKDAEKRFDDVLRQSVARLRIPRREEIARLNARLDAIAQRLDTRAK